MFYKQVWNTIHCYRNGSGFKVTIKNFDEIATQFAEQKNLFLLDMVTLRSCMLQST